MSSSSHFHRNCRVLHFTNEAGEVFKIQVFLPGPKYSSVEEASAEKLPVVLCVHGAGMTSDNFIRLAQVLAPCPADEHQNEEKIQKDADHRELKKVALQEFVDRSLDHIRPPMNMYSTSEVPSSVSLERPARSRDSNGKPPMTLYRTRQYSEEELSDSEGGLPPRLPCSGPSSAMTAERDELPENSLEVCVVSYDMRCHGDSTYAGGESSLTLEVLVKDFHAIQNYLVEKLFPDSLVFVVGHSLGASVVSSALSRVVGVPYTVPKQIAGVVLLDASERVAKRSLHTMEDFLKKRPCSFNSPQEAVEWFLGQGGMQTREAAEISVPPLLKEDPKSSGKEKRFVWKTDLSQTASVWNTWFDALNANFLSVPLPKILCLSSIEMLNADKELIVGQMQGKFQFEVPSQSGHFIHDDVPRFLAKKLLRFIDRTVTMKKRIKNGVLVDLPR